MPNGNGKQKHPGGRPTNYNPEYAAIAKEWCSKFPFTNKDLAKIFNVNRSTICNWKKDFPEFLDSINLGKEAKDQRVEVSLYERAIGYNHPEEKLFSWQGGIVRGKTKKHYPPDTAAAMFWLKNRQPEKWRDKIEIATSGDINISWGQPALDVTPEQAQVEGEEAGVTSTQLLTESNSVKHE